ncbi:hypothetical protein KFL_001380230 [Klebsormidium nitens]|uniref:Uncharacterized protein n=1 Tax=Klebsormidium nitens TaxID=105231 RepID=A0A1Y1I1X7_KLENI|nr:hypothetical protein KFL_001380230 [Klebsormidium nitens]|eukprot:GAQ83181.1 hypothetical protein KFL_001380230 [Klebsormidium nitens]
MARSRPIGWTKSDHRECQAARYARAADYRERISISVEKQERLFAALNAQTAEIPVPRRRRGQSSKDCKVEAAEPPGPHRSQEQPAGKIPRGRDSSAADEKAKHYDAQVLREAVQCGAEQDPHAVHCDECIRIAEFGLRGSKNGGKVRYFCKFNGPTKGCFHIDRDRAAWVQAREEALQKANSACHKCKQERKGSGSSAPPWSWAGSAASQKKGVWASMPMSQSLIVTLLNIGGVEPNPGPSPEEIARDWQEAYPKIDPPLLSFLAEKMTTLESWRESTIEHRTTALYLWARLYTGQWSGNWDLFLLGIPVEKKSQHAGVGPSADVEMQDADTSNQSRARSDILALEKSVAVSTHLEPTSGDRTWEEESMLSKKRKQASPHFVAERLSELFGGLYDKDVGRRMEELTNNRVGRIQPGANGLVENIGSRFKLAGYNEFLVDLLNTIAALVERLDSNEVAPQEKIESALHLGRIIAGPGLGKSTVLQESWIHLHKLVTSLSEEDKRRVFEKNPRLLKALHTCLSRERMLVFNLSFQNPDQGKYHPFEQKLRERDQDWDRVLALRLLHACLAKAGGGGKRGTEEEGGGEESIRDYERFWETFMEQEEDLLEKLSSMKVLDFIRRRANLADDQHALIVFTFDELEAINHTPKTKNDATIGQHLMSAFARLRQRLHTLQCRQGTHGRTFAISLAASTRASATTLSLTASEKAGILDLHVPIQTYLSLKSISLDLFRRSNIPIHKGNMSATFKACLRFLGGVPRTLDRLLVALSGGDANESIRKLDLGKLREVLQANINPKLALREVLDAYQDDTNMRRWKEDPVKREMMESMLAHGLTGETVFRDAFVDSKEKITWQMLESDGFIHLGIEKKEPQTQEGRRDSAGSVDLTPRESDAAGGEGASGQAVLVGGDPAAAGIHKSRSQGKEQGRAGGPRARAQEKDGGWESGEGAPSVKPRAQDRDRVNEGAVSEAVDDDDAEAHGNDPVSRYRRIVSLLSGKQKRRAKTQQRYSVQVCPIIFFAGADYHPMTRQMWLPIFHALDIEWRNREETDLQIPMLKLYVYKKFFHRSTVQLRQLFPGLPEDLARVRIVVPNGGWERRKDQRKYDKEDMLRLKSEATLERNWAHLGPGNYGWDGVYFFFRASEEEEAEEESAEFAPEEAGEESLELVAEAGAVERSSSQAGGTGGRARERESGTGSREAEALKFQTRVQSKKRVRNPTGSAEEDSMVWAPQKVKASTINWEMDAEQEKQGRSDLIVYVTDHRLDSDRSELSENITVVDAALIPLYYGPFFYMKDALDAAFHGANRRYE